MSLPISSSNLRPTRTQSPDSPYITAISEAISSPLPFEFTNPEHEPGPSRLTPSRPISGRPTRSTSYKKDWTPTSASPGSKAAVASVSGTVEQEGDKGVREGDKGVRLERGLSDLIIRSDRSPDKLPRPAISTPPRSQGRPSTGIQKAQNANTAGGVGKGKTKKGWGESIVGGAVNAGVYGAALGVTAYKLWRQSSPSPSNRSSTIQRDPIDPVNPASPASPTHSDLPHQRYPQASPHDPVAVVPSGMADHVVLKESDIPPPPAYRERDHPGCEWTDEVDEDTLLTPSTSRATTLRLTPRTFNGHHPHPLLHNTPSRSWGKKRRMRLSQAGSATGKKEAMTYGQPDDQVVRSTTKKNPRVSTADEEAETAVEGSDEILDRLDDMTLRIQRLILEGQAALLRKNEDVEEDDNTPRPLSSRSPGKGSWGRGRTYAGNSRKMAGAVVRSRRSLPIVGVTRTPSVGEGYDG